jgi:hypothetical protein
MMLAHGSLALASAGPGPGLHQLRAPLAFWFPTSLLSAKDKLATLTTKKIWRTFWCLAVYMMCWEWLLGMLDN